MKRAGVLTKSIAAAALAFACHSSVGKFGAVAYQHPEYPYSVRYSDQQRKLLMPDDWQLDNFYTRGHSLVPKTGADYEATRYLDADGDGESEDIGTVPIFDLRFTHKKTTAVVWLRTRPIEQRLRDKELRVLMSGIVEGISGGGYQVVELNGALYETNKEQRYAAKVVRSTKATLAGKEAFATVVDVSNIDRLKVESTAVEARIMIVLARTGIETTIGRRVKKKDFPVVMLAEYAASPSDFDATLPDFEGLLKRVSFGGATGFALEEPAAPAPPPAAPTQSAPPPQLDASAPGSMAPDGGAPVAPQVDSGQVP